MRLRDVPKRLTSVPLRVTNLSAWVRIALIVAWTILAPAVLAVEDPSSAKTLSEWAQIVFQLGITLTVLAAAIFIAIGAYMYLAASGNAGMAQTGKEYIYRAIMGLVLGLIAWIILNTISTQFTQLKDPTLK